MGVIWIVVSVAIAAPLRRASCGRGTATRYRIWDLSAISGSLNTGFRRCRTGSDPERGLDRMAHS
jgi:hypothetical protein